jgi:protein TonB
MFQQKESVASKRTRMCAIQGTSTISFVVGTNGVSRGFKLRRGCGYGLDEKAVEAVRQWRFRPATKNQQPVATEATVLIYFNIH